MCNSRHSGYHAWGREAPGTFRGIYVYTFCENMLKYIPYFRYSFLLPDQGENYKRRGISREGQLQEMGNYNRGDLKEMATTREEVITREWEIAREASKRSTSIILGYPFL